jgi:mannose-1-phosphate guanylyltransferase/phosphomannomutase
MPQCVVIAGGLGTRLSAAGITTPKLLLEIDSRPLLSYLIEEITNEGYTNVLFCLGNQSEQIKNAIHAIDTPLSIEISVEDEPRGTLGALENAKNYLEDFFTVLMGDTYLSCTNIGSIHALCESTGLSASTLCKFTDHPLDSDLIEIDEFGLARRVFRTNLDSVQSDVKTSMAGVFFLSKKLISSQPSDISRDITRDLIIPAISEGVQVQTLFHQGIIRDLGTPERLTSFLENHTPHSNSLVSSPRNIVLMDRDGTLNKKNGHISKFEEIFIHPAGIAIAEKINGENLKAFLVTNQPVIARGEALMDDVHQICASLLNALGIWQGQDHVYICPHYPESGFLGENSRFKIDCVCRKPKPGLLLQAANEHKFRLTNAIMIGDSLADIYAGLHVGARVLHIHENLDERCEFRIPLGKLVTCVFASEDSLGLVELGFRR